MLTCVLAIVFTVAGIVFFISAMSVRKKVNDVNCLVTVELLTEEAHNRTRAAKLLLFSFISFMAGLLVGVVVRGVVISPQVPLTLLIIGLVCSIGSIIGVVGLGVYFLAFGSEYEREYYSYKNAERNQVDINNARRRVDDKS